MGTADSKQKLGERVIAARKKLEDDKKMQFERIKEIETQSPQTIKVIMQSVEESFKSCSPFLEPTLLMAWESNPEQCQNIVLNSCRKVLNAPINKNEYQWWLKYVFPSSIWMFKAKQKNRFMYEELIDIVNDMQKDIISSMNSIYNHLEFHPCWKQILDIKNKTLVSRQDDKKVGLLQEKGIKNILEMKQSDEKTDELQTFIDNNLATNILTTTAKNINQEFQNHIKTVMSHFGDFKPGPIKKVDRCLSKLENDYQNEAYPKSAKLLDLVRCSITFNTVDQLVAGYHGLMGHIEKNASIIELGRVKNGFLDSKYSGGYRDIKVNVIYHSQTLNPGISMICEVQLLLGQYLHEKKRIHKLYTIIRQEEYFKMTVAENDDMKSNSNAKNLTDLKFKVNLNVNQQVKEATSIPHDGIGKCSVDSNLGLLAVESQHNISCIDIIEKKEVFTQVRKPGTHKIFTHEWIIIDNEKYLSVQTETNTIKFFHVQKNNKFCEKKQLTMCLDKNDDISCCAFDKTFDNIIIVKNCDVLEKRAVNKINEVLISIKLEQKIHVTNVKMLSLSNDGKWCVIAGGNSESYFYLIEIDKKIQHKVISTNLQQSLAPCFINGDPEFCMVAGVGKFEIWDVQKRISIKVIECPDWLLCSTSTSNILAVGSYDKNMRLYNTETWEMFWSEKYDMATRSVHLTNDSKYLTIGGDKGEQCLVLEIQ